MSSERAGTPGDREAAAAYREGFRDGLAEMTGVTIERAGTPTRGALKREATVAAVQSYLAAPSWAHSPYLGVQASEIVTLVLDGPSA